MDYNFEYRRQQRRAALAEKRRQAKLKRIRLFTSVLSFAILFTVVVSANSLITSAQDTETPIYHKYYKQIIVDRGDTVWNLAEEYITEGYDEVAELVQEIVSINGLDEEANIYSGTSLIVPYFSTEVLVSD